MPAHTILFFFLISIFTLVSSAPLAIRDLYVPPVLYPHNGTLWKCGERYNVTWDNSNPPKQISNKSGQVVLRKAGIMDLEHPLATGVDMVENSSVEILVPQVPTGDDYQIVVFGDSGNFSPMFTIECD